MAQCQSPAGLIFRAFVGLAALMLLVGAGRVAVDVETGAVLVAEDAHAPYLPASLTKMMTAYLAFEAIREGRIGEASEVLVSAHAASRPPVRLGLKKGQRISFGALLEATITGSANDAAVAVAEALADSEEAFAGQMNEAARRLGLNATRFANASGLPGGTQQTAAADMALLAQAVLRDFPEYRGLFARRSVEIGQRRMPTTNPLFGVEAGTAGMKTGFTCAAGYNIVALIEREGRQILAVTLGNESAQSRMQSVRGLIRAAFMAPQHPSLTFPQGNWATPPNVGACNGKAHKGTDERPWGAPVDADLLIMTGEAFRPAPLNPVQIAPVPPPLDGWGSYLGAHVSADISNEKIARLRQASGFQGGFDYISTRGQDGRWNSLIYLLEKREAWALCQRAEAMGLYCLVLSPRTVTNANARWRR